jgi:hypothetical protein
MRYIVTKGRIRTLHKSEVRLGRPQDIVEADLVRTFSQCQPA